ncbi:MAG TPA: TetR/AcrR family transcriptional regulator [Flavobacteriales bacterium]|nr:TetR/AcrR family transcriptional regulator [Flavobacteriales bacterium]
MGVKERKEKEKQQRLELILKAAEQVFTVKGFETATVNDVAAEAELGKGTLYLYFTNKDDIILALGTGAIVELHALFQKTAAKHKKGLDQIRALGKAYVDFCKKNPLKYKLLNFYRVQPIQPNSHLETPHIMGCHMHSQQLMAFLHSVITKGIDDRSISKKVDPFITSFMLWGVTTGVHQLMHTLGEHLEADFGLKQAAFLDYYFDFMESALKNFGKK